MVGALAAGFLLVVGAWAVVSRHQQVQRERALVQSWKELDWAIDRAAVRLSVDREGLPDAWEMSFAPDSGRIRDRIDSLEARLWRAAQRKGKVPGLDSLQEDLRRKRERQALALAHCREGTSGLAGRWFLWGFPRR